MIQAYWMILLMIVALVAAEEAAVAEVVVACLCLQCLVTEDGRGQAKTAGTGTETETMEGLTGDDRGTDKIGLGNSKDKATLITLIK